MQQTKRLSEKGTANGTMHWIRVTHDVDNGASGHDIKFYTSDEVVIDSDDDGLQNNCDSDSDNDGILDGEEIGWNIDSDGDGKKDSAVAEGYEASEGGVFIFSSQGVLEFRPDYTDPGNTDPTDDDDTSSTDTISWHPSLFITPLFIGIIIAIKRKR